jgi:hypothetical protein
MERKPKIYQLLRPLVFHTSEEESMANIFVSANEEQGNREEADRFVAGAKHVRVYKNKIKRKCKLTTGIISNND